MCCHSISGCVSSAVQGVEAGKRGVRNAGCWHWLRVISGVSPSETSRCWKVIKNSTRKLLSQGKSISTPKKSGFNSITRFLIYSAFTSKELRYNPGSPISLFYISQGNFVSLSPLAICFSVQGTQEEGQETENGHVSTQTVCPNKLHALPLCMAGQVTLCALQSARVHLVCLNGTDYLIIRG